MSDEEIVSEEVIAAMGISQPAFEEVQSIIGRMPTVAELSTLLAMWEANGRQQSLYGWLKGQHHTVEKNDYLYDGTCAEHKGLREPKVKDCIEIVRSMNFFDGGHHEALKPSKELYLVGDIATDFANSAYAEKYLHLVSDPIKLLSQDETAAYHSMILEALKGAEIVSSVQPVALGGVFGCLVSSCKAYLVGFDILTCREIRLDAFLFGEAPGRFLVSLDEAKNDEFLLKMDEARTNCCFLGRTTKGRVLVDGMDFGPIEQFIR